MGGGQPNLRRFLHKKKGEEKNQPSESKGGEVTRRKTRAGNHDGARACIVRVGGLAFSKIATRKEPGKKKTRGGRSGSLALTQTSGQRRQKEGETPKKTKRKTWGFE